MAVVATVLWSCGNEPQTKEPLSLDRQGIGGAGKGFTVPATNVIPDFFRIKYDPAKRAEFHVTSSQPVAIFVVTTGVQIRTDSEWEPFSEETRHEIWRLKPGTAREIFVGRPQKEVKETWRAYVRYGTEMKGPPLWKAQLREAWLMRSFTNWTGKAWGGGRFNGRHEFYSEEFQE